jgi:hypothetical protein
MPDNVFLLKENAYGEKSRGVLMLFEIKSQGGSPFFILLHFY